MELKFDVHFYFLIECIVWIHHNIECLSGCVWKKMASTRTTFMSSGSILCTESSIFARLEEPCIVPSIFASDSGMGIRGCSNTFWRSKSDMALRYNNRSRRFLLPVCSMIFSCDQAALWMVQSVRPSVRPSVCHTFLNMFLSTYHHEIFRSYYQWQKWRPCKKSRSEVRGQGHRGHDPT